MSPVGVSVGDFVAVGSLAHKLYRRVRDCTGEYHHLAVTTQQLLDLLTNFRDLTRRVKLSSSQFAQLVAREKESEDLLVRVNRTLDRYQSLHGAAPRLHQRVTWSKATVDELKSQLTAHVSALHAFYMSISQAAVLDALELLKLNMQAGNTAAPSVTTLSRASVCDDEAASEDWTGIITDLENLGITSNMAQTHRDIILRYLETAVAQGELPYRADSASLYSQPAAYDNLVEDIFSWLDSNVPENASSVNESLNLVTRPLAYYCPRCLWIAPAPEEMSMENPNLVPRGLILGPAYARDISKRKARSEFEYRG